MWMSDSGVRCTNQCLNALRVTPKGQSKPLFQLPFCGRAQRDRALTIRVCPNAARNFQFCLRLIACIRERSEPEISKLSNRALVSAMVCALIMASTLLYVVLCVLTGHETDNDTTKVLVSLTGHVTYRTWFDRPHVLVMSIPIRCLYYEELLCCISSFKLLLQQRLVLVSR
jgi:hypothetical protein